MDVKDEPLTCGEHEATGRAPSAQMKAEVLGAQEHPGVGGIPGLSQAGTRQERVWGRQGKETP